MNIAFKGNKILSNIFYKGFKEISGGNQGKKKSTAVNLFKFS